MPFIDGLEKMGFAQADQNVVVIEFNFGGYRADVSVQGVEKGTTSYPLRF
ncbi:MAG: hypothetical protein IPK21_11460 [Haliscomenobacter sp.]|nr:hypothetical protein [Haliscomenobacter sp.]